MTVRRTLSEKVIAMYKGMILKTANFPRYVLSELAWMNTIPSAVSVCQLSATLPTSGRLEHIHTEARYIRHGKAVTR